MAVISVNLIPGSWTGQEDEKGKMAFSTEYLVEVDSDMDGPAIVLAGEGVPKRGQVYHVNYDHVTTAYCRSRSARRRAGLLKTWEVTASWREGEAESENPLERRVRKSLRSNNFTRVLDQDQDGSPIVNSAGQPFDPLPEIEDDRTVIVFSRNVASFAVDLADQYKGSVNSDTWYGKPAGHWKIIGWTSDEQFEGGQSYFAETIEAEYNRDGWDLVVLDKGRYERNEEGDLVPIEDGNGQAVNDDVLLDGEGHQLDPDGEVAGVFLTFSRYPRLPFGSLGLE